jgi:serine/threonine protein kinase
MATVFRALDREKNSICAVKVLDPKLAIRTEIRRRFEAEAETMARLSHPNVVQVYEVVDDGAHLFIVMAFIDGPSVLDLIEEGPLDPIQALSITSNVLAALSAAHLNGVIHRDIKPHNILVPKTGPALVTDFGIARITGLTDESMTKTGTVMGTWAFMSPEQRTDAKSVEASADIYSTGATLYAMLCGGTPPDLHAASSDPTIFDKVPAGLRHLIRKSTRYWSWERYTSAQLMQSDVDRVLRRLEKGESEDGASIGFQDERMVSSGPPKVAATPSPRPRSSRPAPQVKQPTRSFLFGGTGVFIGVLMLGIFAALLWPDSERKHADAVIAQASAPVQVVQPTKTRPAPPPNNSKPHITHTPPTIFSPDESVSIHANVLGSRAYDRVVVVFRANQRVPFREATLRKTKNGHRGKIPMDPSLHNGVEYYIEARPFSSGIPVLRVGSPDKPFRLR